MNHDALEAGMFWAGALMALAPVVFGAIVIGVWWVQKRKAEKARGIARAGDSAAH